MGSNNVVNFRGKDGLDVLAVDCDEFSVVVEDGVFGLVLQFVADETVDLLHELLLCIQEQDVVDQIRCVLFCLVDAVVVLEFLHVLVLLDSAHLVLLFAHEHQREFVFVQFFDSLQHLVVEEGLETIFGL